MLLIKPIPLSDTTYFTAHCVCLLFCATEILLLTYLLTYLFYNALPKIARTIRLDHTFIRRPTPLHSITAAKL